MVTAFPWHALPRVSRAHVRAAGRVRRAWPRARATRIAAALSSLLGHRVEIDVRRVSATQTSRLELGARGPVVVLGAGAAERGQALAIEIEAELALAVASALAGGKLPRIARERRVDPEVAGAVAGIAQWLARDALDDELSIVAVEPGHGELVSQLGLDVVSIDAAVRVGVLRATARVAVTVPELDVTPSLPAIEVLHALGPTPLALEVVAASGVARAADLSALGAGDVVVVSGARGDAGGCVLAPARGGEGTRVREVEPDPTGARRVRVEGGRVELAAAPRRHDDEPPMPPVEDSTSATMQLPALEEAGRLADDLAELPLSVRIELGSVSLTARAWASLAPGDVLVLDTRVGDPVTLRVGDRAVARGELVEVDGEVGVRITERAS